MTKNKIAYSVDIAKNACQTLHSRLAGNHENDPKKFQNDQKSHSNLDIRPN